MERVYPYFSIILLESVRLISFPPNTTPHCQPMNQDIFKTLKSFIEA